MGEGDLSLFQGVVLFFEQEAYNQWGSARAEATVGADGSFSIPELPPGVYSFRAWSQPVDDRHIGSGDAVVVEPGEETFIEVELRPTVPVTGRVVAQDTNAPIEGVTVSVEDWGSRVAYQSSATTDSDGRFTLRAIAGEFHLGATASASDGDSGFLPYDADDGLRVGDDPIDVGDLRMPRAYKVIVAAVDAGGNPVQGARVRYVDPDGNPPYEELVTDEAGILQVPDAATGGWRFEACTEELSTEGPEPIIVPRELTVTLVLKPGFLSGLTLRILYDDGEPASDATVRYTWWRGDSGDGSQGPPVREDGVFVLRGLSVDGEYDLTVASPHAPPATIERITLVPHETLDLGVITLKRRTAVLSGTVLAPDGAPLAGATVYALAGAQPPANAVSDEDGRFRLEGLQDSAVCLVAEHPDHGPVAIPARAGDEAAVVRFGPREPVEPPPDLPAAEAWALAKPGVMACLAESRRAPRDSSERYQRGKALQRIVVIAPEDAFAEAEAGGDSTGQLRMALGVAHLEEDFEAAIELIRQNDDLETATSALIRAGCQALPANPDLARRCALAGSDLVRTIADPSMRTAYTAMCGDLLRRAGDATGADIVLRAVEEAEAMPTAGGSTYHRRLVAVCLAEMDAERALALLEGLDEDSDRDACAADIARRLAPTDPDRAIQLIAGIGNTFRRDRAIASIVARLPSARFEDAVVLAREVEWSDQRASAYAQLATVAPPERVGEMLDAALGYYGGGADAGRGSRSSASTLAELACLMRYLGDARCEEMAVRALVLLATARPDPGETSLNTESRIAQALAEVRPDLSRALAESLVVQATRPEGISPEHLWEVLPAVSALDIAWAIEVLAGGSADPPGAEYPYKADALSDLLDGIGLTSRERSVRLLEQMDYLPKGEDW